MTTAVEAIYEDGMLRPLQPLSLPEHNARPSLRRDSADDPQRAGWLAQLERRLRKLWENDADDVFNELLTR